MNNGTIVFQKYNTITLSAADKIDSFLKQCPVFQTAFLIGGPADIFVNELTDQVQFELPFHNESYILCFI